MDNTTAFGAVVEGSSPSGGTFNQNIPCGYFDYIYSRSGENSLPEFRPRFSEGGNTSRLAGEAGRATLRVLRGAQ